MKSIKEADLLRRALAICFISLLLTCGLTTLSPGSADPDARSDPIPTRDTSFMKVEGNSELNTWIISEGGSGAGTESDPYILDGLEIDAGDDQYGIEIRSTSHHFILRNITVRNANINNTQWNNDGWGIYMGHVQNAVLENMSVLKSKTYGLQITQCTNILIRMGNFSDHTRTGILVSESTDIRVIYNRMVDNGDEGILVTGSTNDILLKNNSISNCTFGIQIESSGVIVEGNSIRNCAGGIRQHYGESSSILENILEDNAYGINVEDNWHSIRGNTISSSFYCGIEINNGHFVELKQNLIMGGPTGIKLDYSSASMIKNRIENTSDYGIMMRSSASFNFSMNYVGSGSLGGLALEQSLIEKSNNNSFSTTGIHIQDTRLEDYRKYRLDGNNYVNGKPLVFIEDIDNHTISENAGQIFLLGCRNITIRDQELVNCTGGLTLIGSENLTTEGVVSSGGRYGAIVKSSRNVTFSNCEMDENNDYGIFIEYSENTFIYDCSFDSNFRGMDIYTSDNIDIVNASVSNSKYNGIVTYDVNVDIVDCNLSDNKGEGVSMGRDSRPKKIINNTFERNEGSALSLNTFSARIYGNRISDSGVGIDIRYCQGVRLGDNYLTNCGINIETGGGVANAILNDIDRSNKINGKEVFFIKNATNGDITDEAGQIIIANSTGLNISGQKLERCSIGIQVHHSSAIDIRNVAFTECNGAKVIFSDLVNISRCVFRSGITGIYTDNSWEIGMDNCSFDKVDYCYTSNYWGATTIRDNIMRDGIRAVNALGYHSEYSNNTIDGFIVGIYLVAYHSNITQNIISNCTDTGLKLDGSMNSMIASNYFYDNSAGIRGYLTRDFRIENNTFVRNGIGIESNGRWYRANDGVINGNYLQDNSIGIYHGECDGASTLNNTIVQDSGIGISLESCMDMRIYGNNMTGCGLFIKGEERNWYGHHIPTNNTVNGKQVAYISNSTEIFLLKSPGQVIAANTGGLNLIDLNISRATVGALIGYCRNVSLENCTLQDNYLSGVYIAESEGVALGNSRFEGNGNGTTLTGITRIEVVNCSFSLNTFGGLDIVDSHQGLVEDSRSTGNGIGMGFSSSSHMEIENCSLVSNGIGTEINTSSRINFTYSKFEANQIAVDLTKNSHNNTFHHNDLTKSSVVHARDNGNDNRFDDNISAGNYWDDYRGRYPSATNNGLYWNTPYQVLNGSEENNSRDNYPLVRPVFYVDILPPELIDVTPREGYAGHDLSFKFIALEDDAPGGYRIEYHFGDGDDTIIENSIMGNDPVEETISIPNSLDPLYYRLKVWDGAGNENISRFKEVEIKDIDEPTFSEDMSDENGTTGGSFTFRIDAFDNIEVSNLLVIYWSGYLQENEVEFDSTTGSFIEMTIPEDTTESISYQFMALDTSGNSALTPIYSFNVGDTIPPEAVPGDDLWIYAGDMLTFDGSASTDNIGIVRYVWRFDYQGSEMILEGMIKGFLFMKPGFYTITLEVYDEQGNMGSDELNVEVRAREVPDRLTVLVGPVMDTEDNLLKNVTVVVVVSGYSVTGLTDANGNAGFSLYTTDIGKVVDITLSKEGYTGAHYTAMLNSDGTLSQPPPRLQKILEPEPVPSEEENNLWWIILVVLLLIVLLISASVLIYIRKRTSMEWEE